MRSPTVGKPKLLRWVHNAVKNPGSFSSSPLTSLHITFIFMYTTCHKMAAPTQVLCPSEEKKKRRTKQGSCPPILGMQKSSKIPADSPLYLIAQNCILWLLLGTKETDKCIFAGCVGSMNKI